MGGGGLVRRPRCAGWQTRAWNASESDCDPSCAVRVTITSGGSVPPAAVGSIVYLIVRFACTALLRALKTTLGLAAAHAEPAAALSCALFYAALGAPPSSAPGCDPGGAWDESAVAAASPRSLHERQASPVELPPAMARAPRPCAPRPPATVRRMAERPARSTTAAPSRGAAACTSRTSARWRRWRRQSRAPQQTCRARYRWQRSASTPPCRWSSCSCREARGRPPPSSPRGG
eukprot:SAG11_NODE_6466_length_1308_cov_1.214227_2_plen_232_part_01